MTAEAWATIAIFVIGALSTWGVWCTVSIFKLSEQIHLIKKEIELLGEVKNVLSDIRDNLLGHMTTKGPACPHIK